MQIKLLQWNIWYKENIENIVKVLKELNPDIICLQELGIKCKYSPSVPNTADYVGKSLGYHTYFQEVYRWDNDPELEAIGNGIFSRFPLINTSSRFIYVSKGDQNDFSDENRMYLEAQVKLHDKLFTVGTTHLSYTHKFETTEHKKEEIKKLIDIVREKKENYIVTGDFNAPPDSYTIEEMNKHLVNCGPTTAQNTWTTKPFDYHGFKEDALNWRLDYVFSTNDIKIINSEIIKTDYSDHLPIMITLEI